MAKDPDPTEGAVPGKTEEAVPDKTLIETATSELEDELNKRKEVEAELKKLRNLLMIAESRGFSAECAWTHYKESITELYDKKKPQDALKLIDEGFRQLTRVLNTGRTNKRWDYYTFVIAKYGITSMCAGIISAVVFGYLLFEKQNVFILDVPLWAALIAGLGASAQILVGVVGDVRSTGYVQSYMRLWYWSVPIIAMIFGFVAYLLTDLGLITIGGSSSSIGFNATNISLLNATGIQGLRVAADSASLNATVVGSLNAENMESFNVNIADHTRMVVCFLVGFATNTFIEKLTKLAKEM